MPKKFLDRETSLELLDKAFYGHLGTSGADNQPYITPVNFVVNNGSIYFHCGIKGKKLDNIAWNPRVCFEVSELVKLCTSQKACNFSCRYWSVLVFGKAEIVEQADEKLMAIDSLIKKYTTDDYSLPDENELKRVNVVKINIETISGKMNVDQE
jgi:nitroimidazol reductase NimA-like FMN-containing flavoprotein (pyridoxamine 5'-phosphate oxidase superfamily)